MGEKAGHPFRGNQYGQGKGGGKGKGGHAALKAELEVREATRAGVGGIGFEKPASAETIKNAADHRSPSERSPFRPSGTYAERTLAKNREAREARAKREAAKPKSREEQNRRRSELGLESLEKQEARNFQIKRQATRAETLAAMEKKLGPQTKYERQTPPNYNYGPIKPSYEDRIRAAGRGSANRAGNWSRGYGNK